MLSPMPTTCCGFAMTGGATAALAGSIARGERSVQDGVCRMCSSADDQACGPTTCLAGSSLAPFSMRSEFKIGPARIKRIFQANGRRCGLAPRAAAVCEKPSLEEGGMPIYKVTINTYLRLGSFTSRRESYSYCPSSHKRPKRKEQASPKRAFRQTRHGPFHNTHGPEDGYDKR